MSANRLTMPRQTMNPIAARCCGLRAFMRSFASGVTFGERFDHAQHAEQQQKSDARVTNDLRWHVLLNPAANSGADGCGERALGDHRTDRPEPCEKANGVDPE